MLITTRRRWRGGVAAILAGVLLAAGPLPTAAASAGPAATPADAAPAGQVPESQAVWRVDPLGSPVPNPTSVQMVGAVAVQDGPTAIQRPYVFNIIDGKLWVTWWTGASWVWTELGFVPSGSPIVASVGAITVARGPSEAKLPYAFVRTADGHVWANRWVGDGWSWQDLGAPVTGGVQAQTAIGVLAVAQTPNGPQVPQTFVVGSDGNVWLHYWDAGAGHWYNDGTPAPGTFDGLPARRVVGVANLRTTATGADSPQVFLLDWRGNLWRGAAGDRTWGWTNHGLAPFPNAGATNGVGALTMLGAPGEGTFPFAFVGNFSIMYALSWTGSEYQWTEQGSPGAGAYRRRAGAIAVYDTDRLRQRPYVFTVDLEGGVIECNWFTPEHRWVWSAQAGTDAAGIDPTAGVAVGIQDAPFFSQRPYVFYWSRQSPSQLMVNFRGLAP
ncbi:hypothetical protein [Micromonospora sp. NBC_01813]|uniref:hypothetical protein n=1 Tax=Micromonospora sp. NBC_01813 TaxID=2975988 RepID=UPI002DD95D49|nr:hypothetical protein [Micromonospora sp. NBC_01813]WSA08677.1 hypothetical protein OG958_31635 [Micromonospora sp. NBC_01813]